MTPTETRELALEFAGPIGPGWLVLLVPLALVVGWYLYRAQFRGLAHRHAAGVFVLRVLMLAGVLFLVLRPSVVHRRILTYPGRVLLVLDNSESMLTPDNRLAAEKALYWSRKMTVTEGDVRRQYHGLAQVLSDLACAVRRFEALSRKADRREDAFWEEADRAHEKVAGHLERFEKLAAQAPAVPGADKAGVEAAFAGVRDLSGALNALLTGERHPGKRAFDRFCERASELRTDMLRFQAALDADALSAGDLALEQMAQQVRSKPRLDLLREKLKTALAEPPDLEPRQSFQVVALMDGEPAQLARFDLDGLETVRGETDILGRLDRLHKQPSEFPLAAILLFSDGRDLGGGSLAALTQAMARKEVPVFAVGVGDTAEPLDLAVLDVVAPPIAVKGAPLRVKLQVRAPLDGPRAVTLDVLKGETKVASPKVTLGEREEQVVSVEFTPADVGLFRYAVRFEALPGEAFPARNNAEDFAVQVRPEKVKVLLLDWRPRWETRFALNIFRRLPYVELNPIVVVAQEGAQLRRGIEKGTWPESAAALEMYDLVVLGDLPPDLLTEAECDALKALVEEKGKTVCFLAPGADRAGALDSLMPTVPGRAVPPSDGAPPSLSLTDAGRLHPATRLLAGGPSPTAPPELAGAPKGVRPDAQVLVADAGTSAPLVACRLVGNGSTFLIDTDELWRVLNPKRLHAHAQLYVELVTWSVQGGFGAATKKKDPRLALDSRVFHQERGAQVWVYPGQVSPPLTLSVEAEPQLMKQEARPAHEGASVWRAEFPDLPRDADGALPESIVFALDGAAGVTTDPVLVMEDYEELKRLAQRREFLQRLAADTGGAYRELADVEEVFSLIEPKVRIEKHETSWRLWDSALVLAFLTLVLTLEWIWRKLVGLV